MKKLMLSLSVAIIVMLAFGVNVSAQTDKPYTDGSVWQVQFINIKPGMGKLYLKNLSEGWIKNMRAAKEAGLVLDFKVLEASNASENDWNLMLMYELKNYGMLDGMSEKMEAIAAKISGSEETQHKNAIARNDLRVLQGGRLTRELKFK